MINANYELQVTQEEFSKWLATCPVQYRFIKEHEDYIEYGFFSVLEEE